MPFDSLPDRDKAALETPSAANLAHILRNKVLWPDGFARWYYPDSETCAIGLCRALWGEPGYDNVVAELGTDNSYMVLVNAHIQTNVDEWEDVQPEHVATVIEGYLPK